LNFKRIGGGSLHSGLAKAIYTGSAGRLGLIALVFATGALAQNQPTVHAPVAPPPLATAPLSAKHSIWVNTGFYSAHFDTNKGLRNENFGLGVEVQINDDWSATAGRFINSDSAHSNYVGAYYQPFTFAYGKWGVVLGAFNGYPKAFDGGWFPAVLPVASWESRWVGLNVALIPPLKDRLYGAVSFQLKLRVQD
jgi:hypothetical protein